MRRHQAVKHGQLLAMVTTRGMAATASAAEGYEREREARIQENMERMQKLGIRDLANRFNQSATGFAGGGSWSGSDRWRRKVPVTAGPASPSPARRSLRFGAIPLGGSFHFVGFMQKLLVQ